MARFGILVFGILGVAMSGCRAFAVERSDAFSPQNSSSLVLMSHEKMLDDPSRVDPTRSENASWTGEYHLPMDASKTSTEKKEQSSDFANPETEGSGSSVVSLTDEIKSSESRAAISEAKTSDLPATSQRRSEMSSQDKIEIKASDTMIDKEVIGQTLKNVILLLIDDPELAKDNFVKVFEAAHDFPIHGFLQNCRSSDLPEMFKFAVESSLVSRKSEEDCDCERLLRGNIGGLLTWARFVKEMTTGAISTTNFSVPLSSFPVENPMNQMAKDLKDDSEDFVGFRHEVPSSKAEPRELWRLIDVEKQILDDKKSPGSPGADNLGKQDGFNDGMWNVFDMFTRIRIAFFRILLDSLGNMSANEEEFPGRRAFVHQPSLVEMITDAIREFKSVPNENGFVLVVVTPQKELSAAIDTLRREISTGDTLLVISGVCSANEEPVPFFADGPGGRSLREAFTITDIPVLIRNALMEGCLEKSCKNELSEKLAIIPAFDFSALTQQELPRKRVGRAQAEENTNGTSLTNKTTEATTKHQSEVNVTTATLVVEPRSSSAPYVRGDNKLTSVLGFFISFATMLALN